MFECLLDPLWQTTGGWSQQSIWSLMKILNTIQSSWPLVWFVREDVFHLYSFFLRLNRKQKHTTYSTYCIYRDTMYVVICIVNVMLASICLNCAHYYTWICLYTFVHILRIWQTYWVRGFGSTAISLRYFVGGGTMGGDGPTIQVPVWLRMKVSVCL